MNIMALLLFIASFSIIVFLIANKKNFGMAMIAGAMLLSLSIPSKMPVVFLQTITDFKVIALMIIVVLIKMLASLLEKGGLIQGIIKTFERKLSPRGILIAMPSILGLLPVPGGALLSAPIVKRQGDAIKMSRELQMSINLWYRHIGFMVYPLSTTLIVLAGLSGIDIYTLILYQIPLFIISFAMGYIFVYKYGGRKAKGGGEGSLIGLIPIFLPVAIAVPLSILLAKYFSREIATYISYLIAIPVGLAVAAKMARKIEFKKSIDLSLALAIFGIMFFKNIINATGITSDISSYLSFLPVLILIPLVSFVIGILTAHNMAAIAILYPMFSSVMDINLVIIMFISSFFGYLLSPLHLCIAVTYDYFKPNFGKFYRIIVPPAIIVMIIAIILYGLL